MAREFWSISQRRRSATSLHLVSPCGSVFIVFLIIIVAATPWIALVSCDYNASAASMDEDIFTLARDKGAVSAVRTSKLWREYGNLSYFSSSTLFIL